MEIRSIEDCKKEISEISKKYGQYIQEISTEFDSSSIARIFDIMIEMNNNESNYIKSFPEGMNNLGHEDTMHEFYEVKNTLAELFVKVCSNLSKEELDKVSNEYPASYIIRNNNGHVINDKITVSLGEDNYFTIFPSRVNAKEAIAKFVQEYVSENNPIISGERTSEDIAEAFDLRSGIIEVKRNIANNINYCSEYDIADYIQQCCEERFKGNTDDKQKAEVMLSVLQSVGLSDQGVSMPSDVNVAKIISSYKKGEYDLDNMIFELTNVTCLYHELHTVDEIMNVMGVTEEEANRLLEEESEIDYNGFDTVFYTEEPFSTYLVVENGKDFVTNGFVLEDDLTKKQKQKIGLIPEDEKKSEHLQYEIDEVDSFKKEIKEMTKQSSDKSSDLKQITGRLEDKEQTKETQILEQ